MNFDRPQVSVVVPAKDAEATLGRTLDALASQTGHDRYEIIVVDDGSSDSTAEIARAHPANPAVIAGPAGGPGSARNLGASAARGSVLAFTDADCFPAPDWLQNGLLALEGLELVQGAVEPDPSVARTPLDRTLKIDRESGYYQTANLFVRRTVFDEVGGFEDWIVETGSPAILGWHRGRNRPNAKPVNRGEDAWFGWQARRRGARTTFAADALVHHAVFPKRPLETIRDRWALRHIPALAKRIPEMRDQGLYRHWFFNRRTAFFDLAVAGCLVAAASRRKTPLLAALPYANWIRHEAKASRRSGAARVAVTMIAADATGFAALSLGSVGWRALVI